MTKEEPEEVKAEKNLSEKWTDFINSFRRPVIKLLHVITDHAAAHPRLHVTVIIALSIAFVAIGLFTNFNVDVNEDRLYTPRGSRPLTHQAWIDDESGFPETPRDTLMMVHADGKSVVNQEAVRRALVFVETIVSTPGLQEYCQKYSGEDCKIFSITKFWNHNLTYFEETIQTDQEVVDTLSQEKFPDGTIVDRQFLLGRPQFENETTITYAASFFMFVEMPNKDEAEDVEQSILDRGMPLRDEFRNEPNNIYQAELFVERGFSDEFNRAIVTDIPLVPAVFVVMSIFTAIVFLRRDWVYSRSLLGFGAVVGVLLSIMTGYGILFMIGVPFTSMTQILPFIMFGIGLDDAFIISGAYARTDMTKTPEERIHDTIEQVGLSVLLTTMTSVAAFALGCISSIPAVFWLCSYAFPTIFIDFLYQITFFVAIIIIDERRVRDKRRDCLVCLTVKSRVDSEEVETEPNESSFDKLMGVFAEHVLLNKWVKILVILAFGGLLGTCIYTSTKLTQEFKFTDVLPDDSYVADFWINFQALTTQSGVRGRVYFRYVDQSDPSIQDQMEQYVNELVALPQVTNQPVFFWLRDFKSHVNKTASIQSLPFKDQLRDFLNITIYKDLYSDHIVLDADGNIVTSRTIVEMDQVDQDIVTQTIDALAAQREVGARQPINQGKKDWPFFYFDTDFFIFEFYTAAPQELALTTIIGVAAVTAITFIFIPHWTAALFVFPLIAILYVDLLGTMQIAGLHVNVVSYVALVMSIGLLVDFLMHVLLRYYESPMDGRDAKVKDTLRTMGSSILIGGISTFLGVIPLAFSTSTIFNTIFVIFIGLVTLGAGHGLILLPVLLSLFGPNVCVDFGIEEGQESKEVEVEEEDKVTEDKPVDDEMTA